MNTLNTGQNHSEVIRLRRKYSGTYKILLNYEQLPFLIGVWLKIRVKLSDPECHLSYQKLSFLLPLWGTDQKLLKYMTLDICVLLRKFSLLNTERPNTFCELKPLLRGVMLLTNHKQGKLEIC
jgi:hypothetical protein